MSAVNRYYGPWPVHIATVSWLDTGCADEAAAVGGVSNYLSETTARNMKQQAPSSL